MASCIREDTHTILVPLLGGCAPWIHSRVLPPWDWYWCGTIWRPYIRKPSQLQPLYVLCGERILSLAPKADRLNSSSKPTFRWLDRYSLKLLRSYLCRIAKSSQYNITGKWARLTLSTQHALESPTASGNFSFYDDGKTICAGKANPLILGFLLFRLR